MADRQGITTPIEKAGLGLGPAIDSLDLSEVYRELRRIDELEREVIPRLNKSARLSGGIENEGETSEKGEGDVSMKDKSDILRRIDSLRDSLRERAAYLSKGKIRAQKLSDLPLDILQHIFDFLGYREYPISKLWSHQHWMKYSFYFDQYRRQCVRNARLTCRLFNILASPLLFPFLRVTMDKESLEILDEISKRPYLASGVYGVEVQLRNKYPESITFLTDGSDVDHRNQLEFDALSANLSFSSGLATAMARMLHAHVLNLKDYIPGWENPPPPRVRRPILPIPEAVQQFVSSPLQWSSIHSLPTAVEVKPILLWEIPIALAKAGVQVRSFHLECFPLRGGFPMLLTSVNHAHPTASPWGELQAAFGHVRHFCFNSGTSYPVRESSLAPDDKLYAHNYLTAVLSSPHLEGFKVQFTSEYMPRIDIHGDEELDEEMYTMTYNVTSLLRSSIFTGVPFLKYAAITGAAVDQAALEAFCRLLGPGLAQLTLSRVHLAEGSWAEIRQILRAKFLDAFLAERSIIHIHALTGGEYGFNEFGEMRFNPKLTLEFLGSEEASR